MTTDLSGSGEGPRRGQGAGSGLHRGQGRRPARRRRPAAGAVRRGARRQPSDVARAERDGTTAAASTGCASRRRASRPWPPACARSPPCPIRSARSPTAGCGRTACASARCACRSASSAIIYENRPNVTSDAAALCIKSGNVAFLRGSIGRHLVEHGHRRRAPRGRGQGRPARGRRRARGGHLPRVGRRVHAAARASIDCLVPRGGPSLIASILEHATVPYVIDGDGNCHVYVDASADLDMAVDIVVNAKVQRPSVCNAAESLLVHAAVAPAFLPRAAAALDGVELVGRRRAPGRSCRWARPPTTTTRRSSSPSSWRCAVVPSLDAAIDHISRFGTGHSEAIVTSDLGAADRFTSEVDAAAVLVNALDPVRRRRGVRLRRRDRHHHPEAPRPRPDGAARAHDAEVRRRGRRPDPRDVARSGSHGPCCCALCVTEDGRCRAFGATPT